MERILVGVDGSPAAAAGLAWAARLAGPLRAELVVVGAFEPTEAELPPERDAALWAEAGARLRSWVATVVGVPAGARLEADQGHPASVLLRWTEAVDADLVVVGTRGVGGFAGLHLGSVAHHLAHHTTRPLAIVPAPGAELPLETVVVGVDGSAGSAAAVAWTAGIAAPLGAKVVALHATEPFAEWVPEFDRRSWRRHAEQEIATWTKPLTDTGADVRIVVDRDIHPVAALERAARNHDAGLVVVGARGLGGFRGLRLGRVPFQLVHHMGRPVVTVPPTD
jgi:nucleotide-binding universal stress UspA family protein